MRLLGQFDRSFTQFPQYYYILGFVQHIFGINYNIAGGKVWGSSGFLLRNTPTN